MRARLEHGVQIAVQAVVRSGRVRALRRVELRSADTAASQNAG